MTKVIADISMSLDGYVTARGADPEHGLGIGGEAIHAWVLDVPRSPDDAGPAGGHRITAGDAPHLRGRQGLGIRLDVMSGDVVP
jgi:hypothetical protein